MMGQTIAEHLNEGAELTKARREKLQRRATARKIGKMITRCKAETKAIKKLDDEQKNSYKDCEGVFSAPCRSPSLVPNEPKLV